jgi:hypothetical protein
MNECLIRELSVLKAGDLNAKHMDWNSRLTTARGSLLRDYANLLDNPEFTQME